MASININIPDELVTRVINGMAGNFGYKPTVQDPENPGSLIVNPESKVAFAKRMVILGIKNAVKAWESKQAAEAARQAAIIDAEESIELT